MPRTTISKVAEQLDMYRALDSADVRTTRFVDACIQAIENLYFVQTRILISHINPEKRQKLTDILSDARMTFCHATLPIAEKTSKYWNNPLIKLRTLYPLPDNLTYCEPEDLTELQIFVTNCLNRTTGLFIANKDITDQDMNFKQTIKFLTYARNYANSIVGS